MRTGREDDDDARTPVDSDAVDRLWLIALVLGVVTVGVLWLWLDGI